MGLNYIVFYKFFSFTLIQGEIVSMRGFSFQVYWFITANPEACKEVTVQFKTSVELQSEWKLSLLI